MGAVHCSVCGKKVSNEVSEELVVRAWVGCPECIEEERYREALEEMGIDPDNPDSKEMIAGRV